MRSQHQATMCVQTNRPRLRRPFRLSDLGLDEARRSPAAERPLEPSGAWEQSSGPGSPRSRERGVVLRGAAGRLERVEEPPVPSVPPLRGPQADGDEEERRAGARRRPYPRISMWLRSRLHGPSLPSPKSPLAGTSSFDVLFVADFRWGVDGAVSASSASRTPRFASGKRWP